MGNYWRRLAVGNLCVFQEHSRWIKFTPMTG